jgi:hypothetical protein
MTITKKAWNSILTQFQSRFYYGDNLTEDMKNLTGIQMVSNDILAKLRNTPISIYPDSVTGELRRDTCKKWAEKVFKDVLVTLNDCPDVVLYVVCLDRFGARRLEKMATFLKRQKKPVEGAPEKLTVPPGQERFFEDDKQMPGTMDQIFSTHECKMEFYAYLTEFVQSEHFRSFIPPGKSMILSGALRASAWLNEVIHLPPVQVFQDRVVSLTQHDCDHISEGDLDVLRWPLLEEYMHYNVCCMSYDGDVFSIGLLLIRDGALVPKDSGRRVLFLTRRSIGSEDVAPSVLDQKAAKKVRCMIAYDTILAQTGSVQEAYRSSGGVVSSPFLYEHLVVAAGAATASHAATQSSPSSSGDQLNDDCDDPDLDVVIRRDAKRKAPVWAMQYADLVGIRDDFIDIEYDRREIAGLFSQNPAAAGVISFLLASDSHDYIPTKLFTKGLGAEYVWLAFQANPHKFRDIVMLSETDKPRIMSYAVDVAVLRDLCVDAYIMKCRATMKISKVNNTEEKLRAAQEKKGFENFCKNVDEQALNLVAATLVWTLQYWGNGVFPDYEIPNGLELDSAGLPMYGFTMEGWASKVSVSRFKISPPVQQIK